MIAAVNGPALGAGFHLAYSYDVRLAGGASILNRLFSRSRGRRMFFTGMRLSAAEMYRLGLIEEPVAPERLMAEARALADEIASKSPIAMKFAKEAYNVVRAMPEREAYRFEQNDVRSVQNGGRSRSAAGIHRETRAAAQGPLRPPPIPSPATAVQP